MLSLTAGADLNGRAGCFPFQFDREVVEVRSGKAGISGVDFSERQMAPIKNNNNSLKTDTSVCVEILVAKKKSTRRHYAPKGRMGRKDTARWIKLKFMPSLAFHLQMSTRSELIFKNAFVEFENKVCKSLVCESIGAFIILTWWKQQLHSNSKNWRCYHYIPGFCRVM